jgi:hypothetical protein
MNSNFKKAIEKIRKEWNIDINYFEENTSTESMEQFISLMENAELGHSIKKALKELKISPSWQDAVHQYVLNNNFYPYNDTSSQVTKNSQGLLLEQNLDEPHEIILKVGPETVWSDFKIAWESILKIRKMPTPRRREQKKYLRNLEIFNLHQKGLSINEICLLVFKKYNEEIEFGVVKKVVHEFYKRRNTPESERVELKETIIRKDTF